MSDKEANACANCGKGEDCSNELNKCVACKAVWYIAVMIANKHNSRSTKKLAGKPSS
jgi:hypothetical protein